MARKAQQGVTLIEVLAALVVLALGLFSAAALQWQALHATDSALRATQAVYAAQEAYERARLNGVAP
ncbi:type IV pilus modification PilV family protein [Pseudomonas fontis]|uniref:Prepilin-type N-terminal cleavage/methylation domain-containing protein n=1 Tax=Pseudomonas fontis TaxID=2942633 RepID=A0ABT5NUQ2_9PSED|nr:prepilin-type N-terminal cleavage/methylation domain-containing protein [Pseudomonas fontis]MDD0974246.1 prepilin-type N-terminal cleavage/methylation domain-containing protein [Pseudomonas fontis]MDD0991903.1 prepilin-type N-terminal cleavage/methylation domain-containing protein [Pseudomonas fontis]